MSSKAGIQDVARRRTDEAIGQYVGLRHVTPPVGGWLRAMREMLGIKLKDAAAKIGVQPGALLALEKREVDGRATLQSLRRAADAIDCDVIYLLIPRHGSVQEAYKGFREAVHAASLKRSADTMALEGQAVEPRRLAEAAKRRTDAE